MEKKVEKSDINEPRPQQPTVPLNSPKVSKFGSKVGFVIPKNKLSGSLVPIFRGTRKLGSSDSVKEDSNPDANRRTKWGPDPTQDTAVRKGRILAYQTRLEQITELLKSGALGIWDDRDLKSPSNDTSKVSLDKSENLAKLELEKRELIGEILQLNPSYKAPPDYKPLLKEDKIPVPIKAFPGYNFIVLLLGPESNALKRLEEETGVKVRVLGTKAGTGEKKEITQSDLTEAQSTYEEIYVHVSAETFEKVDAAVALIELLLTPVMANHKVSPANLTIGDGEGVPGSVQKDLTSGFEILPASAANQGTARQVTVTAQSVPLQYRPYPTPWYPTGPTNIPMSSSVFLPTPVSSNAVRFTGPPSSTPISQSFLVHPPFNPILRNSSGIAISQSQTPLQQPVVPQYPNVMIPPQQPHMQHFSINRPGSFPPSTPMHVGGMMSSRLPISHSQTPQATPMFAMGSMHNRPMSPMPRSSDWSNAVKTTPPRLDNTPITAQIPLQRSLVAPPTLLPQQNLPPHASGVPTGTSRVRPFSPHPNPVGGFSSLSQPRPAPMAAPVAPTFMPSPVSGQNPGSNFQSGTQNLVSGNVASISAPISVAAQSTQLTSPHPSVPGSFPPAQVSNSVVVSIASAQPPTTPGPSSGSIPAAGSSVSPSILAPKPPRPSSGDFTFQPTGSPAAASGTSPRPSNTPPMTSFIPNPRAAQPLVPLNTLQGLIGPMQHVVGPLQSPSFRPIMRNPMLPMDKTALIQKPPVIPLSSASSINIPTNNIDAVRPPPRPIFSNSPIAAPLNHHGPLMFPPSRVQSLGPAIPAQARPAVPNQSTHLPQPLPMMIPSLQPVGNIAGYATAGHPSTSTGGNNQTYDPFSPTSIHPGVPPDGDARPKTGKTETEVEYDNLMASMGVR